jgi:uncharacterized delta-60 repeat protein
MKPATNLRDRDQSIAIFESLEDRRMFAAGDLDKSFSGDGKATLPQLGPLSSASDVAVQADGKTVVAGTFVFTTRGGDKIHHFAAARFNPDGSLDKTFGPSKSGTISFGVGGRGDDEAAAVAIARDGSIVVAGSAKTSRGGFDFGIAKLLRDGTLDPSFGVNGKKTVRVKGESFGADVAIRSDGRIIVVGTDYNSGGFLSGTDPDFAIASLNVDGSPDLTFDGDGKRIIGLGDCEFGQAVAIDTTNSPATNPNFGKIIIAGHRTGSGQNQYAMVRLNTNGALDKTFNGGGSFIGKFPGFSKAFVNGVMVQPTGKIVVAGHAIDLHSSLDTDAPATFANSITVARHNANGKIDPTFGEQGNGVAYIGFGGVEEVGGDVIRSANGGLVVAGTTDGKFALAGLTSDGVLDSKFGTSGTVVTDFGADGTARLVRMAAAPGKRITVTGGDLFKTARYLDFGAADPGLKFDPSVLTGDQPIDPGGSSGGPVILLGTAPTSPTVGGRIFSQVHI